VARSAVPVLILASSSTARLRLLRSAGITPDVVVSGVDETTHEPLATAELVAVLAERKASAVAARRPGALILGCDSLLDVDGQPCGKPASAADAAALWRRICGSTATLCTGHCLILGERRVRDVGRTVVRFGAPTDAEIEAYVASGEPMSLAGAFSIDGLGAPFVEGIDGDPGNVIGISLPLLRRMLADLGLAITDLWQPTGQT
jgi:septum formation protein